MKHTTLITAMFCALAMNANAEELSTTSADQTDLHVTIYNSNLAMVKDKRDIALPAGVNTLAFKDVSANIMPETAILDGKNMTLLEQNFEYDLLTPQTLLNKFVGKVVTLERLVDDKLVSEQAMVLANNSGSVLKVGDKIRTNNGLNNLVFGDVPKDLRDRPTLTMLIDSKVETEATEAKQSVALSYLTNNLMWNADYVASIRDEKTLDLTGWVTLKNNSGTTYNNAKLQLVAGEVNRAPEPPMASRKMKYAAKEAMADMAVTETHMAEESLFEYHLYTLPRKTTIKNNQNKQVSLLQATAVPYQKQLTVNANDHHGWQRWRPNEEYQNLVTEAKIVIDNEKVNNLGLPMPAGVIRTYQKDSQGNAQFIGEDRIKHTPEKETVKLKLGESFDITAKRKQTDYDFKRNVIKTAVGNTEERTITASYEALIKNAKDSDATINYQENFDYNWTIKEQSLPSEKLNSRLNRWKVNVPAKGEVKLTFTVQMKY